MLRCAFARCVCLHAAIHRLPVVLVGSSPLAVPASRGKDGVNAVRTSGPTTYDITARFQNLLPDGCAASDLQSDRGRSPSARALPKQQQNQRKRKGFETILLWCKFHDSRLQKHDTSPLEAWDAGANSQDRARIREMDSAAIQWIQVFIPVLSCGQTLILTALLSDLVRKLAIEDRRSLAKQSSFTVDNGIHVLASLIHHLDASEQLERQSLPLLISATYGLDRLVANDAMPDLDDVTRASLKPPQALLFAVLLTLRSGALKAPLLEPAQEDSGKPQADASTHVTDIPVKPAPRSGGNGDSAGEDTFVQTALTVLLTMTPERRESFMSDGDNAVFRDMLGRLHQLLRPHLLSRAALREKLVATLHRTASSPGTPMTAGGAEAADAVIGVKADSEADHSAALAHTVEQTDAMVTNISLQEALEVMRNIRHGTSPRVRLGLLQYFLCVAHQPEEIDSAESFRTVVHILDTVGDMPRGQRVWLTDYVVRLAPQPTDLSAVVSVLPHLWNPREYLTFFNLSPEAVSRLPSSRATTLLRFDSRHFEWSVQRCLILTALQSEPALCAALQSSDTRELRSTVGKIALTPQLVVVVSALASSLSDKRGENAAANNTGTHASGEEEPSEAERWTRLLARGIDWATGIVSEGGGGGEDGVTGGSFADTVVDSEAVGFRLPSYPAAALEAYLRVLSLGVLSDAQKLDDKQLLNHYVRHLFHEKEPVSVRDRLRTLCLCVDHLSSPDNQRRLVDRMIRFNGTDTRSALLRFTEVLAPLAIRLSVFNENVRVCLLQQNSIGVPADRGGSGPHRVEELRSLRYLCNAMAYLLESRAASSPWAVDKEAQQVVSRWVSKYFLSFLRARSNGTAQTLEPQSNSEACTGSESADSKTEAELTADDESEKDEDDEAVEHASSTLSAPGDTGKAVIEAEIEELLALALRMGARIPMTAIVAITTRAKERAEPFLNKTMSEPNDEVDVSRDLYVPVASRSGGLACLSLPTRVLPSAIEFTALIRGNSELVLPLSQEYLRHLLQTCDIRLFGLVAASFVSAVKARRPRPQPEVDLEIVATTFQVLFDRVEGLQQVSHTQEAHDPSELLTFLLKFSLVHLLTTRLTVEVLVSVAQRESRGRVGHAGSVPPRGEGCALGDTATDDDVAIPTQLDADVEPVAVTSRLPTEEVSSEEDELSTIAAVYDTANEMLIRAFSHLSQQQVREVAKAPLDRIHDCFPRLSQYVSVRVSPQLCEFSQKELVSLSTRFPGLESAVVTELRKHDVKLTLDINEYIRVAALVPMRVNAVVLEAYLPSLTFAWCTRLLSAFVRRHDEIPIHILSSLLARAVDLAGAASESDRNLLLMVLQGYLTFSPEKRPLQETPTSAADPEDVSPVPEPEDTNTTSKDGLLRGDTTKIKVSTEELQQRKLLVLSCCDKLMQIESITDLPSLEKFLNAYPGSLQPATNAAVVRRAETKVLKPLLLSRNRSVSPLRQYVLLMHRHQLLFFTSSHAIKRYFFDDPSTWTRIFLTTERQHAPPNADAELSGSPTRGRVWTELVELSTVLAFSRPSPGKKASHALFTDPADTLRSIVAHSPSASERAVLLSAVADVHGTVRKTLQQSGHHGHANSTLIAAGASGTPGDVLQSQKDVTRSLCVSAALSAPELSPSEFAKVIQSVSRLRLWDDVHMQLAETPGASERFEQTFQQSFGEADAHSRCVIAKAVSSHGRFFRAHERMLAETLHGDVDLLSTEDLELVLVTALHMTAREEVERLLDAVGTRMLGMMQQCRRSTLVRLLQCHAQFGIHDDGLLATALNTLESQCCRPGVADVKLDTPQILTVLQACATLDLTVSEPLLIACFTRLGRAADHLNHQQLAQACRLAVELDIGYSPSVNALVVRLLENRDGFRAGRAYRDAAELVCDVYDVEAPSQLRLLRLRGRRQRERLAAYWRERNVLQAHSSQ